MNNLYDILQTGNASVTNALFEKESSRNGLQWANAQSADFDENVFSQLRFFMVWANSVASKDWWPVVKAGIIVILEALIAALKAGVLVKVSDVVDEDGELETGGIFGMISGVYENLTGEDQLRGIPVEMLRTAAYASDDRFKQTLALNISNFNGIASAKKQGIMNTDDKTDSGGGIDGIVDSVKDAIGLGDE